MDYEKIENKEFLDEVNKLNTEIYKLKMDSNDESLLLTILNSLPDNVVMVDNNLKIIWESNFYNFTYLKKIIKKYERKN